MGEGEVIPEEEGEDIPDIDQNGNGEQKGGLMHYIQLSRSKIAEMVNHPYFDIGISIIILINTCLMASEYHGMTNTVIYIYIYI